MELRCLVYSSDKDAAEPICQVLAEMGAEADHCADNVAAVQRVGNETFQIVIADWDDQPDADFLLKSVRARKATERPLTLAIVSDDASVPKALQAGANSILRKPILTNQVRDTLQTARSLLKARQGAIGAAAQAALAAAGSSTAGEAGNEARLRAGDFLQSAPAPSTQIDTESEVRKSIEAVVAAQVDPLKDLEPTAAAVSQSVETSNAPSSGEPRGLEWYLKRKGIAPAGSQAAPVTASSSSASSTPSAAAAAPAAVKPELMGFDQTPVSSTPQRAREAGSGSNVAEDQKTEAELFAYIAGDAKKQKEEAPRRQFRLGKGTIVAAAILAAVAIIAAPQAPWHGQERVLWARGRLALHAWLNPQLVTPAQAPRSHEDFGRAGDEYKLPVAENIPDATTDPSQIKVTPMVDPTAKKPNAASNPDQVPAAEGTTPAPDQATPNPAIQVTENPVPTTGTSATPSAAPANGPASQPAPTPPPSATTGTTIPTVPTHSDVSAPHPSAPAPAQWNPPVVVSPPKSNSSIPSSLKSQIISMTPDASGNKPPDTALPSIEPVDVPEATERALISAQTPVSYPSNAKGQQGSVILQVLIGRDGTVQDAKFLQGSLAFARAAIDGVKAWTFKPYILNGRPVSVQTRLTLTFKPGQ